MHVKREYWQEIPKDTGVVLKRKYYRKIMPIVGLYTQKRIDELYWKVQPEERENCNVRIYLGNEWL